MGNDISRSKNCKPPTWSSWPCVATHASMRSAFSRNHVKSGNTKSMPCISASGNMSPQSISNKRLSCSITMQFLPISPRPPRKITRTGAAISCLLRERREGFRAPSSHDLQDQQAADPLAIALHQLLDQAGSSLLCLAMGLGCRPLFHT